MPKPRTSGICFNIYIRAPFVYKHLTLEEQLSEMKRKRLQTLFLRTGCSEGMPQDIGSDVSGKNQIKFGKEDVGYPKYNQWVLMLTFSEPCKSIPMPDGNSIAQPYA